MTTFLTAWNNRSTAFKLTLLCCLSTVGILVPSTLYLLQLRADFDVSRTELDSMPSLASMLHAVAALNLRRGAADPQAAAAAGDIGTLYDKVLAQTSLHPHLAQSHSGIQALAQRWPSLRQLPHDDPAVAEHLGEALDALDTLRDESRLVYTPYTDSYHLVIGTSRVLPEAISALADLLVDIHRRGSEAEDGRRLALREQFHSQALAYARETDKAIELRAGANPALLAAHAAVKDAAAFKSLQASPDELSDLARKLDASREAALVELGAQSAQHLQTAQLRMSLGLALAALVTGLIVLGSWYTVRTIARGVRDAVTIASRISAGDLDTAIPGHGHDEIGQLLDSMGTMQATIRGVVDGQREMAARHEQGSISFRCDDSAFPGGFGEMVRGTNSLVASHIQVTMRLVEVVQHYAVGDLSVDMDELPGEKAALTSAMQQAKRNLHAINADIKRLAAAAALGDFSLRGAADAYQYDFREMIQSLNRLMDTTEGNLSTLSALLKSVAAGDLTQTMRGEFHGVFASMQDDANSTVHQLKTIVSGIQDAAGSIHLAANEITTGNTDLARRTEQQAANLEETAASMEELTSTVQQNAASARQATTLAMDASGVASDGGRIMGQAVATMVEIEQSSRRISEIIAVIDGIAFQTNILALNAAVEAARAGEQGRGFSVVASEVRTLAQRSATAAKEIKQLIETSVGRINAGSELVGKAGDSMVGVVAAVQRVSDIISGIAAASHEQATGIEQVNQSITQIDETTQQNAALVEEASAAASSMQQQAKALRDGASRFKTSLDEPAARMAAPAPRAVAAEA